MEAAAGAEIGTEWSPLANRMVIALLALLGMLVAAYLLLDNLGLTGPVACDLGDCATVQTSGYARIAGVPVSGIGVAGYAALFGLALVGLQPAFAGAAWLALLLFAGALAGVLFSAYLTFLEAFVIHAWCQWCVVSAALITLIFLASVLEIRRIARFRRLRER